MFPSPFKAPVIVLLTLVASNVAALSQEANLQAGWVKVSSANNLPSPMRSADVVKTVSIIEACYEAKWQGSCSAVLDKFSDNADIDRWRSPKYTDVFFKIDKVTVLDGQTAEKGLVTTWRKPGNIEVEIREKICNLNVCEASQNHLTYDFQSDGGDLHLVGSFTWPDPD